MSHARKSFFFYAAYLAGGVLLTVFGPELWNVHPLVASVAASATTLCFVIAHIIVDTRQLARRAIAQARRRRAEVIAIGKYVARIEQRLSEPTERAPEPGALVIEPDPEVASNLLQFAAHVSARCAAPTNDDTDAVLQADVASAIADARVDLHLQPVVRLPSRQTAHYEALSRIRGRDGQMIPPTTFLAAAAAAGVTADLDTQQLASVISLCNRIGDRHAGAHIFCNLSAQTLSSDRFRTELTGFMTAHAELARRIVFEMQAATALALNAEAVADMRALEELGFLFSCDGASLADVARAGSVFGQLSFAKIAAADLIDADPNVIAGIAKRGTQIIAVRIETERQAVLINELGIGFGQGFLFGEARPARMDGGERLRRAA